MIMHYQILYTLTRAVWNSTPLAHNECKRFKFGHHWFPSYLSAQSRDVRVKHIFHIMMYVVTRKLVWTLWQKRTRSVYKSMVCVFISLQASWQSVYLSWTTSSRLSAPSAAQLLLLSFQSSFISSLWLQKATGASLCLFSLKMALSWSWVCLCLCLARTPRWHVSLNDIKQEKIDCYVESVTVIKKIT